MSKNKNVEEYISLREEILHLDSVINNTIGFFYAFIVTYLVVILEKLADKLFYLNLSYLIIWATYAIVLSKMQGLCKIGAYLAVYHEGKIFNWERRNMQFEKKNRGLIFSFFISGNFPFIFISTVIILISIYIYLNASGKLNIKYLLISLILYFFTLFLIILNRNICTRDYIKDWEEVKANEVNRNIE